MSIWNLLIISLPNENHFLMLVSSDKIIISSPNTNILQLMGNNSKFVKIH